jgi:ring-1,2-phenylacetyl-CoA epoxidase subunit PaaA/ring-1,2-phenylacetyl-CoA epoxidase subunit PaaC
MSDTKLLLGYHFGEWTFGPPAIEAAIAACSMAQEEFGHTRLLNRILDREFDIAIDPLHDIRPPEAFGSIAFVDRPFRSWPELVTANAVVDQAISMELSAFVDASYEPLARVVAKMLLEEKFHYAHAEGWVRLIEARGGEDRDHLREAAARAIRDVAAFFGPGGNDAELVAEGLKRESNDGLGPRLFSRLAGLFDDPTAVGLVEAGGAWVLKEQIDWDRWDGERRRIDPGGPDPSILDELRGTKNVAFKSA